MTATPYDFNSMKLVTLRFEKVQVVLGKEITASVKGKRTKLFCTTSLFKILSCFCIEFN